MELFTTIDNSFLFDAPVDFLKKFWSFGFLFAQMKFGLMIKMMTIPKQRSIQNPVKHLR